MEVKNNIFYRVCHVKTLQGLWYDYNGDFTGFIHDRFNFCKNNELKMDFDEEIVGWLSATDSLEKLFNWLTFFCLSLVLLAQDCPQVKLFFGYFLYYS